MVHGLVIILVISQHNKEYKVAWLKQRASLGIRDGRMFYSLPSSTKVVLSERQVIWIIGSTDIPSGKKNVVSSLIANQKIALPDASSVETLGGCCDHNPE